MKTTNDQIFGCIGVMISVVLVSVVGAIINGWALSTLWGWFIVPVFDLPILTIIQAIGISLILGYITSKEPKHSDDRKSSDRIIESTAHTLATPLFSVGIGWIVLQFT